MKFCPSCNNYKDNIKFSKSKFTKDGLRTYCKDCRRMEGKIYYKLNKKRVLINQKKRFLKFPYLLTLKAIKERCNNKKDKDYPRYGGRGIKCLINTRELKGLWFRDKAYDMKKPSIDRINNDGHYEFDNCRYIEHSDNSKKGNK